LGILLSTLENRGNILQDFSSDQIKNMVQQVFENRYKVVDQLGKGGMGSVFLVRTNDSTAVPYALKLLSKRDYVDQVNIYAEIDSLRYLNHPGIPLIMEVKEDDSFVYIVQEYIRGIDLKSLVEESGAVDEAIVIVWMEELANIFDYLHKRDIIHRDIKPGNIMLSENGQLKVIDFGLARTTLEKDGVDIKVVGTIQYTAPERFIRKNSNKQNDVYGFGATLYYLLTGKTPLGMKSDYQVKMASMMAQLKDKASPAVFEIIQTCMEVDPQNRYETFEEILFDCHRIRIYNRQIAARRQSVKRNLIISVTLLVFGFLFVAGGVGYWYYSTRMTTDSIILSADKLYGSGDYVGALSGYNEALSIDSGNTKAHLGRMKIYLEWGGYSTDIDEGSALLGQRMNASDEYQCALIVGYACCLTGNYDAASTYLNRAKKLESHDYLDYIISLNDAMKKESRLKAINSYKSILQCQLPEWLSKKMAWDLEYYQMVNEYSSDTLQTYLSSGSVQAQSFSGKRAFYNGSLMTAEAIDESLLDKGYCALFAYQDLYKIYGQENDQDAQEKLIKNMRIFYPEEMDALLKGGE